MIRKAPKTVEGWLTEAEGEMLMSQAVGKVCLEVGSYKGRSACYIASSASKLICIDPFKKYWLDGVRVDDVGNKVINEFLKNTCGYDNIILFVSPSERIAPIVVDEYFDFVFIDGRHDYDAVKEDIACWFPKLKIGGLMFFHDYCNDWSGVVEAVNGAFGVPDKIVDSLAMVIKK